jgi:hypothetical protein
VFFENAFKNKSFSKIFSKHHAQISVSEALLAAKFQHISKSRERERRQDGSAIVFLKMPLRRKVFQNILKIIDAGCFLKIFLKSFLSKSFQKVF